MRNEYGRDVIIILVGNKSDLTCNRQILFKRWRTFMETSAKFDYNDKQTG